MEAAGSDTGITGREPLGRASRERYADPVFSATERQEGWPYTMGIADRDCGKGLSDGRERVDGGDDLVDRGAHPERVRAVYPVDHAPLVEQEVRREKDVLARIDLRHLARDQRRRHASVVADVQGSHQRTADVRQDTDRQRELAAQRLRDLGRVDADGHHLDSAIEYLPVALAELAELRRAEGSPAAAVEDEQVALPALGGEIEHAAVRGRQAELREPVADPRTVLAGGIHCVDEEEPQEEGEENCTNDRRDRTRRPALAQRGRDGHDHAERGDREELPGYAPEATEVRVAQHVEAESGEHQQRSDERHHHLPRAVLDATNRDNRASRPSLEAGPNAHIAVSVRAVRGGGSCPSRRRGRAPSAGRVARPPGRRRL